MDTFSPEKRREIMQSIRRARTQPEEHLAALLRELHVKFQQNVDHLPGKPDILIPSSQLVIFVNGCFWHGHMRCRKGQARPKSNAEYWATKIERNTKRDKKNARALRKLGYSVFTVWECQLSTPHVPMHLLRRLEAAAS